MFGKYLCIGFICAFLLGDFERLLEIFIEILPSVSTIRERKLLLVSIYFVLLKPKPISRDSLGAKRRTAEGFSSSIKVEIRYTGVQIPLSAPIFLLTLRVKRNFYFLDFLKLFI